MLGPLAGLKVIEFEGIGPGPLAGRMLADQGSEVVVVVRPNSATVGSPDPTAAGDPMRRGKRMLRSTSNVRSGRGGDAPHRGR